VDAQPLPRVDPALLLADLLDEPEASVLPAFDRTHLEGLPNVITSLDWVTPSVTGRSDKRANLPSKTVSRAVPLLSSQPRR